MYSTNESLMVRREVIDIDLWLTRWNDWYGFRRVICTVNVI